MDSCRTMTRRKLRFPMAVLNFGSFPDFQQKFSTKKLKSSAGKREGERYTEIVSKLNFPSIFTANNSPDSFNLICVRTFTEVILIRLDDCNEVVLG